MEAEILIARTAAPVTSDAPLQYMYSTARSERWSAGDNDVSINPLIEEIVFKKTMR